MGACIAGPRVPHRAQLGTSIDAQPRHRPHHTLAAAAPAPVACLLPRLDSGFRRLTCLACPSLPPSCRLCCLCGTSIAPNPTNMCVNCIRTQVDITAGLQKQVTILWCKSCGRYLQPPKHWLKAELGELLLP